MRPLLALLKWSLALGLIGSVLFGLYLVHLKARGERNRETAGGDTIESPRLPRAGVVDLEEDEAERYGLEVQPGRAVPWYARVSVCGRVVPNPQASAEIRSPFAGVLRAASGSWPTLGQHVRAGQTLGRVDVRVGPEVRLDLENKLAEARIRQQGAEEEVKLQQSRADSLKSVTSQQILSRGELDAALIQLAQAKNQLATAKAAAELWQKALREVERHNDDAGSPWSQPLLAPAEGEVTDLAGRPGMATEAGASVLTLVDFRRPLIRLDLPPEVLAQGGPPRQVQVQIPIASLPSLGGVLNSSQADKSPPLVEAHLAGPAPRIDVTSQFVSYWYEPRLPVPGESAGSALWRPGVQVTAEVRPAGAGRQAAIAVPARAILYHEGRPLVYVRISPEKFQRREVRLLGREGDSWVLAPRQGDLPVGVTVGEAVVTHAAQVLLSKEFLVGAADND